MSLWAPTSLVISLCLAPLVAQAEAPPSVQQFTLSNGMTLIVKPDHRAPTAVQMLWVRVGSMDEVDGTSGVAHVLEHMMFKGTPKVPAGDFSRRVAALGGRENAFTAKDYTGYYQQIPANRLQEVMQLEADRFANNQWSNEVFVKELEVVKEERRLRTDDNPHARLFEAMTAQVYQAHPYRRPIVGWMSDLDAMTPDDARAFHQRWYTPANAALVIAGDVDVAQVRTWAQQYYGGIASHALPVRKPREEPAQSGLRRMDFKAPADQAYVALAFKVPGLAANALNDGVQDAASDEAFALTVLSAVLDGYEGARLDRALTQPADRVADNAGSHYGLSARGPVLFMLSGVPAAGKTAAELEQALRAQVATIAKDGVQESELERVKTQWVAGEIYKQDSVFNQARTLGANWATGFALDADQRVIARLRKVTAQQVQAVAAKYFGDDALTVATLWPQPIDKTRKPRAPVAGLRD
ncbi:M16 family metallopeptidase [Rhodoferax saidenbachensis]|uniref:M16 family metallopeptidase n=1 Tax=Rhodoferax saidenbachensis TaxID=1484693 RepID=UPI0005647ECE